MNEDTEPLAQFQDFYRDTASRPAFADQSFYAQLRAAFYAGFAARPRPPIEPSRNALDSAERSLARYAEQRPNDKLRFYPAGGGMPVEGPLPDYIQHGTITGRLGPMPRRDPDKATRMRQAYGIEPVAGPDPATLERVHDELTRTGQVEYPVEPPSDDTNPRLPAVTRADTALMPAQTGLEHTETVWDGRHASS